MFACHRMKRDVRQEKKMFEDSMKQFRFQHEKLMEQLRTQKKEIETALKQMKDQVRQNPE